MANTIKKYDFDKIISRVVLVCALLILVNTCTTKSLLKREIVPDIKNLTATVDSINNIIIDVKTLEYMLEINGYNISYRMLYDNNVIIRTTKRPDDVMNEYTSKLKELRKNLEAYKHE